MDNQGLERRLGEGSLDDTVEEIKRTYLSDEKPGLLYTEVITKKEGK